MNDLIKEFLTESTEGLDRMERCLTELEAKPADSGLLAVIFRTVHTIKGSTGFLGFQRLERLAHAAEHLLGSLRDLRLTATPAVVTGLLMLLDRLRQIVLLIEQKGHEGTRGADNDGDLIALLEGLETGTTQPGPQVGMPAVQADSQALDSQALDAPAALEFTSASGSIADRTLRVDIAVLNRMMNLTGELVLTRNQVLRGCGGALAPELARRLDCVTVELRETVMQVRLQPLGTLFGRFPRMVRDLARECGKEIRLEMTGQQTALDKSLLEAVKDPLAHALRNAIDHGIETPDLRLCAGKPVEGVLRLSANQTNGLIVIELEDDGAGIVPEQVLARAVERGLVTPERAAALSARETFDLLFLPGFSTASTVTHISGRGVGMDVVKQNVEQVGGSVEIESTAGCGTVLRLRVPLTLAIVPAIVVQSGAATFCLPQSALVELVYVPECYVPECEVPERESSSAIERMGNAELYRLRDELLPLVRLNVLLDLPATDGLLAVPRHGFYLAVLETDGTRYGLLVDNLLAPEEIVVKPLSETLRRIGLYGGATVLGTGQLAMILDVQAIALRSGMYAIERKTEPTATQPGAADAGARFVLYERHAGAGRELPVERMAMPLERVERIESIQAGAVEYSQGRPMLQYRGAILPLDDEGGCLALARPQDQVALLICTEDARPGETAGSRFGLVVNTVLEVTAGAGQPRAAAAGASMMLLNERVPRLALPARMLQEVA